MIVPSVRCRALIGRGDELELIRETRRSLARGRGGVVLISGDAGIGKTRLLHEFTQSLSGGRAPLYALGECLEHAPSAYGPLRQILESLVRSAPWATPAAPPLARRMLRTLVPDAVRSLDADMNAAPLERAELFSAVLAYVSTIAAKRALVVALEDLHWADAASLELLGHLAGRISGTRLMLVATYRDRELSSGHPLFGALARLVRMSNVTTAALEPLTNVEMTALVLDALGGYDLASHRVQDVVTRSEGNPLFAEELLKRALSAGIAVPLPISIRGIILERLGHLDAEARSVLEQAALVGPHFDATVLGLVSARSADSLAPILQRLQSFDLIVPDRAAGGYRFRHALTREAVYGEIHRDDARRLHAKIAHILAALPDAADRLDDLAYHTWEAGLRVEAREYNERAGEKALSLRAPAHAATYFLRALRLADEGGDDRLRTRLLERAGVATSQSCDFANSIATFTALHDMHMARGEYDAAGIALMRAANDTANLNRGMEAMALLRAFLAAHGERLTNATRDHVHISLAYLATTQEAHGLVPELLDNVREPGAMATHAYETYWLARLFTAERQADLPAWLSAAAALRERLDEAHVLARGQILHSIGQTALPFAQNDEAERSLDEAIDFDREHGLTHPLAFASAIKIRLLYLCGRVTEAVGLVRFTLANRELQAVRTQLMIGGPHVALAAGDDSLARRCIDEQVFIDTNDGEQVITNAMLSSAMSVWLESAGRVDEARVILNKALDMLERPFTDAQFWCVAARLVDGSRFDRLRALCAEGAANPHDGVMRATLAMVEAILAERGGDGKSTRAFAMTAGERYRRLGWPLLEAKALELAGRLDAALTAFRSCQSIADVRRLELRQSPAAASGPPANRLSPREREVAGLVARGYTNRAIADALYISGTTVEKHVTKIYAKLDFSTRTELAAYIARAGTPAESSLA